MSIAGETKKWIERGMEGGNTGLPMGMPRLEKYIPGLQKATTYLVGGESGSGKSKLAASMFIYNPYEHLKQIGRVSDYEVLMLSLEIEKRQVLINAAINRLYRKYNILTDVNMVLSRGENRCSQELYDLVCRELDWWEQLEDVLTIIDIGQGPTGINKAVLAHMYKKGTVYKKTVDNGDGPFQVFDRFEYHNPDLIVSPQVDHVGLQRTEKDLRHKKELIEKLSTDYAIPWRNNFGCSPLFVQQLNRTLSSSDRAKIDRVRPQLSDFKESAATQEDANVVLALFSPNRYSIPVWEGYEVARMRDRFRGISILKNRDGQADKILGAKFIGECGYFEEMPSPKDMAEKGRYEQIMRD